MNNNIQSVKKIKVLLLWPILVAFIIAAELWLVVGFDVAKSAMLGASAVIFPQAVFGFYCFRYFGALQTQKIWKSFVRGEVYKLALSAVICFLAFHFMSVNAMWFILTFILMQLIVLFINCWLLSR